MQTTGVSPARSTASVFLLTVSSVSPKYCRLSLCPTITAFTPISLSIGSEISPVKAPLSSKWQFCAPTKKGSPAATACVRAR